VKSSVGRANPGGVPTAPVALLPEIWSGGVLEIAFDSHGDPIERTPSENDPPERFS
jgi:hypothetical protein